jgi:hypothetical protein
VTPREIVQRAIEFRKPPRLAFFQHDVDFAPDDVCDCWEMDRQKNGWFFDPVPAGEVTIDDWGCRWAHTEKENMGQVAWHPLSDWASLRSYRPPNPRDPFYFERIAPVIDEAADRYVVVTCHFNLWERLHMLRGFANALEDFYAEPRKVERLLDMILEFKLAQLAELHRRFADRVDGVFLSDDWGSQQGTFISPALFRKFFLQRYTTLGRAIRAWRWHFILHSCGKINEFVPMFIDAGAQVLNMTQPRVNGLAEFGRQFAGKVAFLTSPDTQRTLPSGDVALVRNEARELLCSWSTPDGGFIVFGYSQPGRLSAIGAESDVREAMFRAFTEVVDHPG